MPKRDRSISFADIDFALGMPDESFEHYVHRKTGEVVTLCVGDSADEDEEMAARVEADPDFVLLPAEDSWTAYNDMVAFVETVEEPDLREKLELALEGRGAFSRFRSVLGAYDDLAQAFEAHQRAARVERVERWLESAAIELPLQLPEPSPQSTAPIGRPPEPRSGLIELLMLGGKAEYMNGAVVRYLYCDSPSEARAAFKRIAREIVEHLGRGWRGRYVQNTSELALDRFRLVHEDRHVYLHVKTPLSCYLAFSG